MQRMTRAFSGYEEPMKFLACALLALAACGGGKKDEPKKVEPKTGSDEIDDRVDGPPKQVALTAKKLAPVIHELGVDNVVPTSVTIEMAVPIIDGDLVGGATQKTVLKVTPEI